MKVLLTAVTLVMAFSSSSICDEIVRISVLSLLKPHELVVSSADSGRLEISTVDPVATQVVQLNAGEKARISLAGKHLHLEIVSTAAPYTADKVARISITGEESRLDLVAPNPFSRSFRGTLVFQPDDSEISILLTAPLEQVVGEVTAAEMGTSGDHKQALMAQAVCVRSYLLALHKRKQNYVFDDTTRSLLYRGRDGAFGTGGQDNLKKGEEAARTTLGIVISHAGKVVPGYFHSCCGGSTATAQMVWKEPDCESAFVAVKCDLCTNSLHYRWQTRIDASTLRKLFRFQPGSLDLNVQYHPDSLYVSRIEFLSSDQKLHFDGEQFRIRIGRTLGWNTIRSNAFTVKRENEHFQFEGYGYGHGVGFCQEGALQGDRIGWSWKEILTFYFPRCTFIQLK